MKWRNSSELASLARRLKKQSEFRDQTGQCIVPSRMIKHLLEVIEQAKHTEEGHELP